MLFGRLLIADIVKGRRAYIISGSHDLSERLFPERLRLAV